jgi:polyisoprenoid-binding protein YceI
MLAVNHWLLTIARQKTKITKATINFDPEKDERQKLALTIDNESVERDPALFCLGRSEVTSRQHSAPPWQY